MPVFALVRGLVLVLVGRRWRVLRPLWAVLLRPLRVALLRLNRRVLRLRPRLRLQRFLNRLLLSRVNSNSSRLRFLSRFLSKFNSRGSSLLPSWFLRRLRRHRS